MSESTIRVRPGHRWLYALMVTIVMSSAAFGSAPCVASASDIEGSAHHASHSAAREAHTGASTTDQSAQAADEGCCPDCGALCASAGCNIVALQQMSQHAVDTLTANSGVTSLPAYVPPSPHSPFRPPIL